MGVLNAATTKSTVNFTKASRWTDVTIRGILETLWTHFTHLATVQFTVTITLGRKVAAVCQEWSLGHNCNYVMHQRIPTIINNHTHLSHMMTAFIMALQLTVMRYLMLRSNRSWQNACQIFIDLITRLLTGLQSIVQLKYVLNITCNCKTMNRQYIAGVCMPVIHVMAWPQDFKQL
jgi:hypothetical protein